MIKTKDGYAKLIGTTYSGSVSRVLLSNGGDHILGNSNGNIPLNNGTVNTNLNADMLDGLHIHAGRNNEVNKIVRTDANGFLQTGWINTTSGNIGTGAINKIYCSNDDYIRYKTPANFFPTLANSGNDISITVAGQNRTLTVGYATNADKVDGYHASSFALVNNINYADLYAQKFITGKLNDGVTRWLVYAFNGNQTQTVDNLLSKIPDKVLSPNGSNVVTQLTTGIYLWEDNNIGSGNYADSYTGYARTYLYSNSAQTLTFVIYTDDNSSIFLNNTLLATPSSCQNTSLSFSLVKGWNKIEIIWYEGGGGDGFHVNYNGSRLHNSFLIDCFAIDSNNYSNSAGSATKVIVTQHTANDINYPLVWSNQANTNTVTENQLHKSWSDLYYNPKNKRLTVGGSVVASSFVKSGGTSQQLLRADGGIATFNWSGQSGQPTWLWGGNNQHSYYVYNPSNFRVAYASSAGNADTLDGYHASKFPYINNSGVWKVYGNSAAAALADNTAGLSSWAFGESRNSGITYLGILKPSTATCGISAHGTIAVFGQGDTHLGIASDYSGANLQVFGGNADKIVWRKKIAFADGTGVSGTWGINISGNAASATKSEYSRSLLGRSTSGSDYDTNRANLVFAEWDTMHDNRWYLKATGCECRVAYANSAKNAANADTIDGVHLNGIFTAFGNNAHNITATIGGVTKSFLVNWAADSDKLDGYHENSFLRYRGNTGTDQEATLWSQIGIKQYNNALPDNLTGVYNYGSVISLPGSSSRFEIYASHQSSSGNGLYYRSGWGSDKRTWLKFIDSSNIGSQSVNYATSAGNAETLGGMPKNYGQAPFNTIPCVSSDGVMEIGRYIDYHYDNSGNYDFSTRLQTSGNNRNVVTLPSESGTLALTSYGGDYMHPIFLGYLNLDHGDDGTVSSSFYCLGYSVPFTYTRGGNYCRISIPDTTHQVFYIRAAIASVNYSGGGMDTWTGYRRGDGAWWLHCYASNSNEVRVKGFRLANDTNDSWWGGNPLWSSNGGANVITVCIFGYVTFK